MEVDQQDLEDLSRVIAVLEGFSGVCFRSLAGIQRSQQDQQVLEFWRYWQNLVLLQRSLHVCNGQCLTWVSRGLRRILANLGRFSRILEVLTVVGVSKILEVFYKDQQVLIGLEGLIRVLEFLAGFSGILEVLAGFKWS